MADDQNYPDIEFVCQALEYKDGSLYWSTDRPREHFVSETYWKIWNTRFSGQEAGGAWFSKRDNNYRWRVRLSGKLIFRSILVYAIHNQRWPDLGLEIDHIDHNTENDRIENLRLANRSEQNANRSKRSDYQSGYKGVYWNNRDGKWEVKITVNGKHIYLGYFNDPKDAHEEYKKAAIQYFGPYACF